MAGEIVQTGSKDPQHKKYLDLLNMDTRRVSQFQESFAQQPWALYSMFAFKGTPIEVNENAIDLMTFWEDEDEHNICPLPYGCHCDPGTPIEEFNAQKLTIESFKAPQMKTNVRIANCNPKYFEHQLRELPGLPWSSMTPRQRLNLYTAEMLRRQSLQMDVTEKHQFYDFLVKGKHRFYNPSIPEKEQWVDLGRDPNLQLELPECEDWALHPEADRIQHIRWISQTLRDVSGRYSKATHHILTPSARRCLFKGNKWKALQCCNGDGRVMENFSIDLLYNPAFRGIKRIPFIIGEDNEFFYELDEEIVRRVEVSPGKFVKVKEPVIPDGLILTVAEPDLRPMSIYGMIEHMDVLEARRRWVNRYKAIDGSCINYDSYSAPFHPLRGINSTLLWNPCASMHPSPMDLSFKTVEVTNGD